MKRGAARRATLLVVVCLTLYGCSSEPSDVLAAGTGGEPTPESSEASVTEVRDLLFEDSLDQIVSPAPDEEALSQRTSFVLLDEDGSQLATPGAETRRWSIQAWRERSGDVSFATEFHHFSQDDSGAPTIFTCAFNSGLIVGDAVAGYRYFEGRRPNVTQRLDIDGFDCDDEPHLLSEEEALFSDVFFVDVVDGGFEVTSADGQVLRLVRQDS